MPLRILVVEDNESFRRYVCSMLEKEPEFQVVAQVSDGLDAIQKAKELQPDLVVLDIGLPKVNGVEAAARMRNLAPLSKILFLSQEFSSDIVEAALRLGALGYVHKMRAQRELLPAVRAALGGKYFVSGVLNRQFGQAMGDRSRVRHEVQFYSNDAIFLESSTDFIADALKDGKAAIVILTESHRAGVLQGLNAQSLDVASAIERGALIPLGVTETLSRFMLNERPNTARFFDAAGKLIEAAAKAAVRENVPRVAVCREYPPSLLAEDKVADTMRLEQLWGQIAHTSVIDILCGYALASFEKHNDIFQRICREHSAVYSH
jgi:DNA-binding NarL/FixJ family response regulator